MDVPKSDQSRRRKRSVNYPLVQNVTRHTIEIIDHESSFKLKDCRIWEESEEGEVLETHVYDFEKNILIEDSNTGGSSLNATYIEDGVEKGAEDEVPEETEEEKIETISVVLRPRGD